MQTESVNRAHFRRYLKAIPASAKRLAALVMLLAAAAFAAYAQTSPTQNAEQIYNQARELEGRGRDSDAAQRYAEAARICSEEITAGRGTLDTYNVYTKTLRRQKKYTDVISMGERSFRLGNDLRIVETMGEAYFYLENYNASLRSMQRYVNALPEGGLASVAWFFIGEIYRIEGKNKSADIAYTTALHVEGGGVALWWYRLGSVREAEREYRGAAAAYETALKIQPSYRQASEGLERTRRMVG
jgi:tetratricopeptide (TPR) repeat protein